MNYYDILKIDKSADKTAVKRAYFAEVKQHSPDADPEGFKLIRTAYETLFDDKKRREYDGFFETNIDTDLQSKLLQVCELVRQNKLKEALDMVQSLGETTDCREVKLLTAEVHFAMNKVGLAERALKLLLADNPNDYDALLLQAEISSAREHCDKARKIFEKIVEIEPANPKGWHGYVMYAKEHLTWAINSICERAIAVNPDMFKDDYITYLYAVKNSSRRNALISFDEITKNNIGFKLQCFEKFVEFFTADKSSNEEHFYAACGIAGVVWNKDEFAPAIKKLLPVLKTSRYLNAAEDKVKSFLDTMKVAMEMLNLRTDKRIHGSIASLTMNVAVGSKNRDERTGLECYIVLYRNRLLENIKLFRKEYPQYYALNSDFFNDVLNDKKMESMHNKHYRLYKNLIKRGKYKEANIGFEGDDFDEYGGEDDYDDDDFEIVNTTTFVRETPKVGANELCPCGSGMKFKKCCK